jgi:CheY-like chemotaxis protein
MGSTMENAHHHILVAEDSSVLRLVLRRTFSEAGFAVTTAADGLEAWDQVQQHDFDAIVTDEQMPGLSGSELCERLRQHQRWARTPIIMVTAKAYELDRDLLGDHLGISTVFVKPFSPSKVLRAVQQCIHSAAAESI